jgi:hypothetical protein
LGGLRHGGGIFHALDFVSGKPAHAVVAAPPAVDQARIIPLNYAPE